MGFFSFIEQFLPDLNSTVLGENYFDRTYQMLYLLVKGTIPVEIHTTAVIFVSFQIPAMTEDDFYSSHHLVRNLALFLKIPSDKIRISKITGGEGLRKKRSMGLVVELEIGDPPAQFINNDTAGRSSRPLRQSNVMTESAPTNDLIKAWQACPQDTPPAPHPEACTGPKTLFPAPLL